MNEQEPLTGNYIPLSDKEKEMLSNKKKTLSEDEYNKFVEVFNINNKFEWDYCINFSAIRTLSNRVVENINKFLFTPNEYEDSPYFKEMFRDPDDETKAIISQIQSDIHRIDGYFNDHLKLMENPEKVTQND